MGPNSKRARQAAAAQSNTPARARFSSGPVRKKVGGHGGGRGSGRGRGDGRGSGGRDGGGGRGGGGRGNRQQQQHQQQQQTKQKVVQKIALRATTHDKKKQQAAQNNLPSGFNAKTLDEITLSPDAVTLITELLQKLNVVDRGWNNTNNNQSELSNTVEAAAAPPQPLSEQGVLALPPERRSASMSRNEDKDDAADGWANTNAAPTTMATGYTEYEEDGYEEGDPNDATIDTAAAVSPNDDEQKDSSKRIPTTTSTAVLIAEDLQRDPVFVHLTTKLSFSRTTVATAIRAVGVWSTNSKDDDNALHINKNKIVTSSSSSSKLSLALDWLCLHLPDADLKAGFRPHKHKTASSSSIRGSDIRSSSIPLVGTGKTRAIPHPSISVATKLTEDTEWMRRTQLEERAIQFLALGFTHADILAVLQEQSSQQSPQQPAVSDSPALSDTSVLVALLTRLEEAEGIAKKDGTAVNCDDDNADEGERGQEREALTAIYDDKFQIIESASGIVRYKVTLDVRIEDDNNNRTFDHSIPCELHVFVRSGYPTYRTPLFLLYHPSLPWPLLRRLHTAILTHARDNHSMGEPSVFDAVSHATETLPDCVMDYRKEERARQFHETQARLRKEAGHDVERQQQVVDGGSTAEDLDDDSLLPLSRRQRSRKIAAEKAFDKGDLDQLHKERIQALQSTRLERVKLEDKSLRQTLAEKAVLQREQERHEKELRTVTRAAMSQSFSQGNEVGVAQAAARAAELQYRKLHGMTIPAKLQEAEDEGESERKKETVKSDAYVSQATPTTTAFMDRLREMYSNAAKGNYKLENPASEAVAEDDDNSSPVAGETERLPCPIASPVGDLAQIMEEHVLAVQKEQPWLVAPEARTPSSSNHDVEHQSSVPELSKRQKDISEELQREFAKSQKKPSAKVKKIREQTRELPAYQMRDEIVSTIRSNQVTLISASTGAGKTTVTPTLILNDLIERGLGYCANIWVTQPRRISAIGVAERIASERGEKVGETCGYAIKLEKKCSKKTRITLCTTGILLRRLQCDPDLANVSHVIVDEVHERDINSDFALIILKDLLQRRKSLKLILMSATFDKDVFAKYFNDCKVVEIPGRAHPVQEFRLEDVLQLTGYDLKEGSDCAKKGHSNQLSKSELKKRYYPKYDKKTMHSLSIVDESVINYELLAKLLEHLCCHGEEGAILVFLPGMGEISNAIDEMRKFELFQSDKVLIYPLHSSLSTTEQTRVFEVPPAGIRKIVVSTNIAETSITVSDVLYVVDCGRVKENRRDEVKEAPALIECWVSRASAQQRRGRAGRVRPGIAYHMFSSHTFDTEMQDYQLPEMSRVGIEDLVLQVLILDLGEPSLFLAKALTPPTATAMKNSLSLLEELGAIECHWQQKFDENGSCASLADTSVELTALGFHLATLPVEPRIGKVIIYGALFGCVEPALTIAASMSSKNPFLSPFGNREAADEARQEFCVDGSDHLTILEAFNQWSDLRRTKGDRATSAFTRDSFLSRMTLFQMDQIRLQFSKLLIDLGFLPRGFRLKGKGKESNGRTPTHANANAGNVALVKAILCAGLYPNIILAPRPLVNGKGKQKAGEMAFQSRSKGEIHLHPSTLLFNAERLDYRFLCYREIMQTRKLYIRDATVVSPFALLLFGGALRLYQKEGVVSIDDWLKFRIAAKPATLVKYLRSKLEGMLLEKIISPEDDVTSTPTARALIESVSTLLHFEILAKQGN